MPVPILKQGDTLIASVVSALTDQDLLQFRDELARTAGATAPDERVVVLRVLAARVEPAMQLLTRVWSRWRELAWGLPPQTPRIWRT